MTGRSQAVDVARMRGHLRESVDDRVAVEEPLEIRLGYSESGERRTVSVSITMRTPCDDEDLAAGFLFTEGIVRSRSDVAIVKPCRGDNTVRVELDDGVAVDFDRLQRHFYTTSSCGVCGKASLDALYAQGAAAPTATHPAFPREVLVSIPGKLREAQATFEETGGLHAAAAFSPDGELIMVREDVGRHNAVDKVIGALLMEGALPASSFGLMVSGRASFELVQKTLLAGIPLLAAVSAPSSLAVQLAREFNMTLIGFLRGDTFNVYAGEERLAR
ncbi:MAG: formate dehydrogenase accessory sulfurtransferase FdhD [Woeseiaceae bacterium]|nr:formate dehydrogenase accessory sulfurtransferase FdhD [Woeseiaceae bacterium]